MSVVCTCMCACMCACVHVDDLSVFVTITRQHTKPNMLGSNVIIILFIERAHIQQAVRGALKHSRVKRNRP